MSSERTGKRARSFHVGEISRPEDIIPHLGKGERHWKKGYSAYELAHSWINANGIPPSVRIVLDTCPHYQRAEFIQGIFEKETDLRTAGRDSQTDLLVLVKLTAGYGVIGVEGKVEEPFGPTVKDWNDHTSGKERRLEALCKTLGLMPDPAGNLRYQLFHRTVSTIYEAHRYHCGQALMLVHSFSARNISFDDFSAFAEAMRMTVSRPDEISGSKLCEGVELRLGWIKDQPSAGRHH